MITSDDIVGMMILIIAVYLIGHILGLIEDIADHYSQQKWDEEAQEWRHPDDYDL